MTFPEIKHEVKVYLINAYCPDCGNKPNPGCILKSTGEAFMTFEPSYIYKCTNCNTRFESKNVYPRIEYESN